MTITITKGRVCKQIELSNAELDQLIRRSSFDKKLDEFVSAILDLKGEKVLEPNPQDGKATEKV